MKAMAFKFWPAIAANWLAHRFISAGLASLKLTDLAAQAGNIGKWHGQH